MSYSIDYTEIFLALLCVITSVIVIQDGVEHGNRLVHGVTAAGILMMAMYYFLTALNLPAVETNSALRELLVRPGLVVYLIGSSLILVNGKLRQWIRQTSLPSWLSSRLR